MVAVCYLVFLKVLFFQQLVSSGELIRVVMQNFVKISQTVSEILRFFDFQDGRLSPSRILKFLSFWFPIRVRGTRCIITPNFIKIG